MVSSHFSGSEDIFDFVMRYVNVEKGQKTEFKLDRMRQICGSLGDPHLAYPTIHIAGSKGKGSVSTMIARILEASGKKTGLYTSPHHLRWKERISLAGDEMPESLLIDAAEAVHALVAGKGPENFKGAELPTYFELTTLIGFEAFRRASCARAVIETGLGGRLDSTNVVDSVGSVITPIELEHTEWLGDTISLIAAEKAGIIKPGKPCFLSRQSEEALAVFERVCSERESRLFMPEYAVNTTEIEVSKSGTNAKLSIPEDRRFSVPRRYTTPLIGGVQAQNMALALLTAAMLEPELTPEQAALGLSRARLPARFEILPLDPPVVLDGAHTPNSIRLTLETFDSLFSGKRHLLFACAHDKHHAQMAALLARRFDRVTITKPGSFKQSDPKAVFESFSALFRESLFEADTTKAVNQARTAAANDGAPLLVTGSFYLCSEAARLLEVLA